MSHKRLRLRLARLVCLAIALLTGYAFLPSFDVRFNVPSTSSLQTYKPLSRQETVGSWKDVRVAIVEYAPYHEGGYGVLNDLRFEH
jgi:hypothetical protein